VASRWWIKFPVDIAFALVVLVLAEGVKWTLWRLWDAEVIFVGIAMPMFIIFYYRGLLTGILATLVFVFCEYWLFERPQGYAWHSLRFLSLASVVLLVVPVLAYFRAGAFLWATVCHCPSGIARQRVPGAVCNAAAPDRRGHCSSRAPERRGPH
jgi:hypothetical protein